ncbi:DUF6973 domain-containing protein [Serratia microhaemolytica]|uniref:DUF6973 domain-containing protein n=1 Tax=Serratia microhaemolytica TaxID=2675110 RepID=UPI003B83535A
MSFAVRYPNIAAEIGVYKHGWTNISTNAVRFATLGDSKAHGSEVLQQARALKGEGTQVNAFRHVLWQTTITARYGEDIAIQVGNAHEDTPYHDLSVRTFSDVSSADPVIDLLNNQIGRQIGKTVTVQSMQKHALLVLDVFYKNGLYVAKKTADGVFFTKEKITRQQYHYMKSIFEQVDDNGREKK